jgi:uncharacterized protein (DUF885 family)
MTMWHFAMAAWLLVMSMGSAIGTPALSTAAADAALRDIWQTEWSWRQAQFPLLATETGQHQYDDQLGDVSDAAEHQRRDYWRAVLAQLARIDPATLSNSARVDYTIYRAQIASFIANIGFQTYLMPLNSDSSFYGNLSTLARNQPLGNEREFNAYLSRLRAIPRYFAQHRALLRQGLQAGITPPKITLKGRAQALAPFAHNAVEELAFYQPFKVMPASIDLPTQARLRAEAKSVLQKQVQPAYAKLLKFMEASYLPGARENIAAYQLPNGEAFYRQQILDFVTEDLSATAIHQIGLDEVARIQTQMQAIMDELKFTGSYADFLQHLRTDPQFYAKTAEELLMHGAWIAKRADAALPKFFGRLPRRPYGVQAVPAEIAEFYTAGRYIGAPEGSSEPGWYWLNTSQLRSRPLYNLAALTLHEAVPGHHLQISLASELAEQPPFRRYSYISAYGEGWALYCEALGLEMGIYRTPYERFGQLTYAMWRANRLVIDTGIHAKGWSRKQAIDYMSHRTALSQHEIETEIDRYISWPGQALSYMLGNIRIRSLREEAQIALGAQFDLRAFHDTLLETGSVPLPVLSAHVRAWIAKSAPKSARH